MCKKLCLRKPEISSMLIMILSTKIIKIRNLTTQKLINIISYNKTNTYSAAELRYNIDEHYTYRKSRHLIHHSILNKIPVSSKKLLK